MTVFSDLARPLSLTTSKLACELYVKYGQFCHVNFELSKAFSQLFAFELGQARRDRRTDRQTGVMHNAGYAAS